jgi:hypothetical protein
MRVVPTFVDCRTGQIFKFMCFLSAEKNNVGGRWVGDGKSPALAVRHAVRLLRDEMELLAKVLKAVQDG